jgi:hypothetical protein
MRPPFALSFTQTSIRFGVPTATLAAWCEQHPTLAQVADRRRWIDPAALGLIAALDGRLDCHAAARRFGVPVGTFPPGMHPAKIGVLLALLPLDTPAPGRRRKRTQPDAALLPGEVRHASD